MILALLVLVSIAAIVLSGLSLRLLVECQQLRMRAQNAELIIARSAAQDPAFSWRALAGQSIPNHEAMEEDE